MNFLTEVISVRFKSGAKNYYFDPKGLTVAAGDDVIVETTQGLSYAVCVQGNHPVEDEEVVQPLCPVMRLATENDRRTVEYNTKREKEAFSVCKEKILAHGLEMKLVDVSCNFDGNKIIFFFTADGRVDFRELVKDLASIFRARIELRQIGVRDEAKMLGGLGICGRPFCCSQFLDGFLPVSIKMAKTQSLSLNPTKISGTCGRLMCCLKYEQDAYEDAVRRCPKQDSFVQTPDGPGNVMSVNLLKESVKVRLDSQTDNSARCYHNCEVCVLRNGKGTRDGIDIPARTTRYEKRDEEELASPVPLELLPEMDEELPTRERMGVSEGEKPKRKRNRSRHRGGERPAGEAAPQHPKAEAPKPPREHRAPKPQPPKRTEGPKAGEHAPREGGEGGGSRRPHHRGGRRRNRGGGEGGGTPPKGE